MVARYNSAFVFEQIISFFLLWIHHTQTNKHRQCHHLFFPIVLSRVSLFFILFYCTQDWRKVPSCVPLPSNNTFTFITKQIVIINIFIVFNFSCSLRPVSVRASLRPLPQQLVLRTDGPRSPCTSTLGVCVTWERTGGGGAWQRSASFGNTWLIVFTYGVYSRYIPH